MIKALAIVILKPKKYFEMGARSTMMSLSVISIHASLVAWLSMVNTSRQNGAESRVVPESRFERNQVLTNVSLLIVILAQQELAEGIDTNYDLNLSQS